MQMDEVIRAIEETDVENIQDVMQAAMGRYRELYPKWQILFLSVQLNATDERSKAILELICKAEELIS